MSSMFPEPILNLPQADISVEDLKSYLLQNDKHQIIFTGY